MIPAEDSAPVFGGERIRAARALLGVSQTKLASAIGVAQSAISQYESGTLAVGHDVLDRVAQTTGLPRSFFNMVPADLPPASLRFRRQARARATETTHAMQLLSETYRVMWMLVRERPGYIPPTLPIATDQQLTDSGIEEFAEETRIALGITARGPVMHVTRALERGGVFVVRLGGAAEDDGSEFIGHFGASCWPGAPDPALIGYFPTGQGDRQRFTLGHETGHLVLHTRRPFVADPEGEANRFAGALLVPRRDFEEAMESVGGEATLKDFVAMKARWGVSIQALIMRGGHLGLIDPARRTSLFKQISARGWRKNEPVVVHGEDPVLLRKLLDARFGTGRNSNFAAENRLGLPAFTLGQLAPRAS